MEQFDVCIIGGGMAGASLAFRLAPLAKVVLLEREPHVAYHSTGRSAALYHPQYGSPVIRALTTASGPFFHAPPAGFAPILTERGSLIIGRAEQQQAYRRHEALAAASGQAPLRLSAAEVLERVPGLKPSAVDWGLYDAHSMDMDVDALLQGFLRAARVSGLKVETSKDVTAVAREGARWRVSAGGREFSAGVVVNAAGAWADATAALAGVAPLSLVPYRRTAFTFEAPAGIAAQRWPMVADADEQFYFKPDAGRLLGSLSEEVATPPCDVQPDEIDVAIAVDRLENVLDFPIRRVLRSWAGLRTFGPDRNPVSGFDPAAPGFYWHAGIGGYGIQTSAALGAYAAAMILGRPLDPDLAAQGIAAGQLGPGRLRS